MIAIASSRRTGPRRSGLSTLLAARACAGQRPSARPSSVRIAHAHDVGPCTSTPLARAIPPSRTFSSAMRSRLSTQSRIPQIEPQTSIAWAAWRMKLTPSSRSSTGIRSSAEWIKPGGELGVHRARREEAVGDGAEGLAEPVAVGEAGHADRRRLALRLDLADPAGDCVPERSLDRRARAAVRLELLELVVPVTEDAAHDRMLLGRSSSPAAAASRRSRRRSPGSRSASARR